MKIEWLRVCTRQEQLRWMCVVPQSDSRGHPRNRTIPLYTYTQQTDRYNMMSIDQPFDHRSARHLCRGGSTNVSQRSEICMHVWIVADKYLQFISICTVASKGLALGWFIARHDNLEFKSLLRNGPRLISLCLTCPPDTSFVTDSIKLPSRYQLNLGLGLP